MKEPIRFVAILTMLLWLSLTASNAFGQDCPSGKVCLEQATANRLYSVATELIAAKDVINKMLLERGASDAALTSAQQVIKGWSELDAINNTIIAKQKDVIALYERTIQLYHGLVDGLEKRLMKGKSSWDKFVGILKTLATLAAGITLGRGL